MGLTDSYVMRFPNISPHMGHSVAVPKAELCFGRVNLGPIRHF